MKTSFTLVTLFSILGALALPAEDAAATSLPATAVSTPVVMLSVPEWSSVRTIFKPGDSGANQWAFWESGNTSYGATKLKLPFTETYKSVSFSFVVYEHNGDWLATSGSPEAWDAEAAAKLEANRRLLCSIEATGPVPTGGPVPSIEMATVSPWISGAAGVITAVGCAPTIAIVGP